MKSELVKEVWKPVLGYEGLYEVSNFGRVKSLNYHRSGKPKIMNPKKGFYYRIQLYKKGVYRYFSINRLVYEAFHGPIPRGMQVNHINEIKSDNSLWNLNLMTPKENTNYGTCIQRRSKKKSKQVYQYTLDGKLIRVWPSTMECDRNGFKQGAVSGCCRNECGRKTYKGSKWSYTPLN